MLKGLRIFSVVLVMACSAACGNNGATSTITKYGNYSSVSITPAPRVMGGAVQGTPLPLVAKDINSVTVSTIAGTPGTAGATDGIDAAARFNMVNGITADGKGNLYIADYGNHTIRKYSFSNHSTTTIAGVPGVAGSNTVLDSDGTTPAHAYGASGGAPVAQFYNPSGITTDGNGNLYVADYNNDTIRRIAFTNTSTVVTTIAGSPGTPGSVDDTYGYNARFNHPTDVTTDGTNLYVTDSNNLTIRKIGLIAPYSVTTVAGSPGNGGSNPPVGAAAVAGSAARFRYPARITTDGSNLYVTDFIENTISRITIDANNNTFVSTIAGTPGVTGSADGIGAAASFDNINGITSDGTNLYVTDTNNHTIRMIDPSGKVATIAGSARISGSNTGTVSGAAALFRFPVGITTDGTSLYVTDSNNYTIRKIE